MAPALVAAPKTMSRRAMHTAVVLVLGLFALLNVEGESGRKLHTVVFGHDTWGEFWESIYSDVVVYTPDPDAVRVPSDGGNIGYFLTLTHCPGDGYPVAVDNHDPAHAFYDAAAMLKFSISVNSNNEDPDKSKYGADMYAIVHPDAIRCTDPKGDTYDRVQVLKELGYKIQILGSVFGPKDLHDSVAAGIHDDAGYRSMMPLWLLEQVGHPAVVSVDFSTFVMKPLDQMIDNFLNSGKFIGYSVDYPDNLPAVGTNAGVNTNFIMFRPNPMAKEHLLKSYKRFAYSETWGWANRGVRGFSGVYGLKGYLAHHFSRVRGEFRTTLSRCMISNSNHPALGVAPDGTTQCYDNIDCADCRDQDMSKTFVLKMIEVCGAPWDCSFDEGWDAKTKAGCSAFHKAWFEQRAVFESTYWQDAPPVNRGGTYETDVFLGYCSCAGPECYSEMIHDNGPQP